MGDEPWLVGNAHEPPELRAEIVESGVDYLTVTARSADAAAALYQLGYGLWREEVTRGCDPRPFNWLGFEGFSGGQATVGKRDDGTLLRLSGSLAAQHWRKAGEFGENCSRIDLQVTARFPEPQRDWAHMNFLSAAALANARGRDLDVKLYVGNHPGATLYLGKRTSQLFGRLYDKEAESGEAAYRNCWRWEVEVKQARALRTLAVLRGDIDAEVSIQAAVHEHFVTRGVRCPWVVGVCRGLPVPAPRSSDDERRVQWLRTQVAPVVGKLLARRKRHELLKAVGLNEPSLDG